MSLVSACGHTRTYCHKSFVARPDYNSEVTNDMDLGIPTITLEGDVRPNNTFMYIWHRQPNVCGISLLPTRTYCHKSFVARPDYNSEVTNDMDLGIPTITLEGDVRPNNTFMYIWHRQPNVCGIGLLPTRTYCHKSFVARPDSDQ